MNGDQRRQKHFPVNHHSSINSPASVRPFARRASPPYGLQPSITRTLTTGETHWTIYTDANGFRCSKDFSAAGRRDPAQREMPAVLSAAPPRAAVPDQPQLLVLGDSFAFGMAV